jgi:hypothetical protein
MIPHLLLFFLDGESGLALYSFRRGVAQFGSAPRLGRGGRRFKSARPDFKFMDR